MRHFPQNLAVPPSWIAMLRIHSGKGRHLDGRNRDSAGLADGLPVGHAIEVVPLSLALPCPAARGGCQPDWRAGGTSDRRPVQLEAPCSKYVLRSADNVAESTLSKDWRKSVEIS